MSLRVGDVLFRDAPDGEQDIAVIRRFNNDEILLDVTWANGVQFVARYRGEADVLAVWDHS